MIQAAVAFPLFRGAFPAREEIQIAYAAGNRYQFVVARAMELVLLTGIVSLFTRGWGDEGGWAIGVAVVLLGLMLRAANS